jgi:sulfur carrier protein ThiS
MSVVVEMDLSPAFQSICPFSHLRVEIVEQEITVKGLLHQLADRWGEKMKALLFEQDGDAVLSGLMVLVNDQTLTGTALNVRDVPLRDGDKVSLLYFVSGG